MGIFKKALLFITAAITITFAGAYLGSKYKILGVDHTEYANNIEVKAPNRLTINKDTVLEFNYIYTDGITSTQSALPAAYMTDYDRKQLAQAYGSWQMESFSPARVVFVKNFDCESSQHYILKEYKGYVGVFYKKSGMLKELTATPISSLSQRDIERYREGVAVDGDENLMKHLEGLET